MSINRAEISGNLTRDPELRQTASGIQILELGVAVNDRRKNQQTGEWEDSPNFIDCTVFGNRAQSVAQYLSKGMKVFIAGKLHWSQWERDGQKHSKVSVVVDDIEWAAKAAQQQAPTQPQGYQQQASIPAQGYQQQPTYQGYSQQQPSYAQPSIYDENIPF